MHSRWRTADQPLRCGTVIDQSSHGTRTRFSEFSPRERLVLTHVVDFLPGVKTYESTIVAEFFPSGEWVRMVVALHPMHDEESTKMSAEGLSSQLIKLDKRFDRKRLLKKSTRLDTVRTSSRRGPGLGSRILAESRLELVGYQR
jgi:hypothetical protein